MRLLALILFYIQFKLNLSESVLSSACDGDHSEIIEDYYWRDYHCILPKDAVPGGTNAHGNTTYIGQVLHENQIIPAEIDIADKKVIYELGYIAFLARKNIKILCSSNTDQFEWVTTANHQINNITNKHFVVAGFEPNPNIILLMGRKFINGAFVLGKVLFTKDDSVLVTTKDGRGIHHNEFDVLAYRTVVDTSINAVKQQKDSA